MREQKRVLKGVHARLRRAIDARERAYDPRIHRKSASSKGGSSLPMAVHPICDSARHATADEHGRSWYQSPSVRLQIFGDIDFRRQRADRGREVDEFLELGLVLVRQLARHVVT